MVKNMERDLYWSDVIKKYPIIMSVIDHSAEVYHPGDEYYKLAWRNLYNLLNLVEHNPDNVTTQIIVYRDNVELVIECYGLFLTERKIPSTAASDLYGYLSTLKYDSMKHAQTQVKE
jgi:hypothetical protein